MTYGIAPSLDDIEIIARTAMKKLPFPFARHLQGVILRVEDFPDAD
ncbi:MAG: neutral zinc metallopeptidase, partial [Asticcacaulis sp.]|nr:neutral zinc metallopeptidase [Asticcacaulis sp.]